MRLLNLKVAALCAVFVTVYSATPAWAQLRSEIFVSGLTYPVGFVQDPSWSDVQYVVEQGGRVRVIRSGVLLSLPFLDISAQISGGGERGLLGLAFPLDYGASGRFYVNFTNSAGDTVIRRYRRSAVDPLAADVSSAFDLRWPTGEPFIRQPYANHNGGHIVFGPDGYLYIGMGDGGSANDPHHFAQNPQSLLGKMLRIDVGVADAHPTGYVVPNDNPFVDGLPLVALPEIWSFGLRNPWQFSFDSYALGGTGAMFIGDVGQARWEEVDYEPAGRGGRNYGWRNREGLHDNVDVPSVPPAYQPLVNPLHEYAHSEGYSITGGVVYRGSTLASSYRGRYFFADFILGRVWSLGIGLTSEGEAVMTDLAEHTETLGGSAMLGMISGFGMDSSGEMYVLNWRDGTVLRILQLPPWGGVPSAGGFNQDGKPDVVWQRASDGALVTWLMDGLTRSTAVWVDPPGVADASWKVVAGGDFNADGRADLLWQHQQHGGLVAWLMNGTSLASARWLAPTAASTLEWKVVATGDFNGDGRSDLLWQHDSTGGLVTWLMAGTSLAAAQWLTPSGVVDPAWRVVAVSDFDNDGHVDLLWQHSATGGLVVWLMNRLSLRSAQWLTPTSVSDTNWRVVAAADLSGDGKPDLLWQHRGHGGLVVWIMNGLRLSLGVWISSPGAVDPTWRAVAVR